MAKRNKVSWQNLFEYVYIQLVSLKLWPRFVRNPMCKHPVRTWLVFLSTLVQKPSNTLGKVKCEKVKQGHTLIFADPVVEKLNLNCL